jgi:acetate kinase
VAHRVVHGGPRLRQPVVIDEAVREEIFRAESLAPLHAGPALRGIEHAEAVLPGVAQVAVFDTGFHATIPEAAATYALPRRWREEWGVQRYGFHGLSVQWSSEQVRVSRLIVCHLGGGCSVTAVLDGRSVDTTMGFTPLEGVPMATRSGSIDPNSILYVMREHGLGIDDVEGALNHESGLKGLAGGSGDMRELEERFESGALDAIRAVDVFVHRLASAIGSMSAATRGLDALVFTGGIGEGSALVRSRVCDRLGHLGVELDESRNMACNDDGDVSAPSSVRVAVVWAREELIAARAAVSVLG